MVVRGEVMLCNVRRCAVLMGLVRFGSVGCCEVVSGPVRQGEVIMERRLIEEFVGMKGGLGRLEKILGEYKTKRADGLSRVQEIDELIELIIRSIAEMKQQKSVDSMGES